MTLEEWKSKHCKCRGYAHFDAKISLNRVWNYISNPQKVAAHSFYPFIHFPQKQRRIKDGYKADPKIRDLCYSAHLDRYVYQYYGFKLNQMYNEYTKRYCIDECAIAYRDNRRKNNIHFAKEVFDFIRGCNDCYIVVGDFTKFFDRLDHKYIKRMICKLLNVSTLPDDYYAVFKNITRYTIWEMEDILRLNGLENTRAGYRDLNNRERVLTLEQFRKHKKEYIKLPTEKERGIPQGSAISAILSNIYMLDFDKEIYSVVSSIGGIYRRYSDDFIVVMPATCDCNSLINNIFNHVKNIPHLDLQSDKTKVYHYGNGSLANIKAQILGDVPDDPNILNYLGFSFDGRVVTIRNKTILKYYYRMYRKLKTIIDAQGKTKDGKRISCKNLYKKYTIKGANLKQGNFITYVKRATKVFGDSEAIDRSTKNHMQKIRKKLNTIKNQLQNSSAA